jgi:hypothetical protein
MSEYSTGVPKARPPAACRRVALPRVPCPQPCRAGFTPPPPCRTSPAVVCAEMRDDLLSGCFHDRHIRSSMRRLVETPRRWKWQDWGLSNSRENLHRLGGHPCWIQGAEIPRCPQCDELMPFLLQFDSFNGKAEWLWGSGGILYVHWCDSCRMSAIFWQCT